MEMRLPNEQLLFFKLSGRGDVKIDQDEAVALLEERVKDRNGEACWMLGLCCEYGMGTAQDIKRAEELYKKSMARKSKAGLFLVNNGKDKRGSGVMTVKRLYQEQGYVKLGHLTNLFHKQ